MAVAKLSKRVADALEAPEKGERWVWDTEAKGLGLKVTPGGRKVFFLKYRSGSRVTRKYTIGPYGALTVDQARAEAQRLRGEVAGGTDPARERARGKAAPTVSEALRAFLDAHKGKWKPRTHAEYTRQASRHIIPAIGTIRVADVTRADIGTFVRRFEKRPILGNRVLALLSSLFTWAIRSGFRSDDLNPCRHIPRYAEKHRTRFLSADEITRLGTALEAAEEGTWADQEGKPMPPAPWQSVTAIRLLLLTGCRRSEILDLRWAEVDFEMGMLHLRDTKAGESARPMSDAVRQVLESLPRGASNERVLPGSGGRRHEIKPVWTEVRRLARLDGVRLHDLRHTVASRSQHAGHSLLITGSLLGHKNLTTTKKYAHLVPEPVQEAADRVAGEIEALLSGRVTPVVSLGSKRGRRRA
ncbi:MAG: integrase arm-type DNA-binding domain-containing protein [Gemmatimonadales bacterium]